MNFITRKQAIAATKTINALSKQKDLPKPTRFTNAFDAYSKVNHNERDCHLINSMLRLCANLNHPQGLHSFWNDLSIINNKQCLDYLSLFKCCTLKQALSAIQWMVDSESVPKSREFKDFSINISKLIAHRTFNATLHHIQRFESLLSKHPDPHLRDDIFIKTAFIQCYGTRFGAVDDALNTFHSVEFQKRDSVLLNAMMNVFYSNFKDVQSAESVFYGVSDDQMTVFAVNAMMSGYHKNGDYYNSLRIYRRWKALSNVMTDILALRACINTNHWTFGMEIARKFEQEDMIKLLREGETQKNIEPNFTLKSSLIQFYCHFGDIDAAQQIFNGDANEFVVGAMMQGLIKNHRYQDALQIFQDFKHFDDTHLDMLALTACIDGNEFDPVISRQLHAKYVVSARNLTKINDKIYRKLIRFHGHFNHLEDAIAVFQFIADQFGRHSTDSINFGFSQVVVEMLQCLVDHGDPSKILLFYDEWKVHYELTTNPKLHVLAVSACLKFKDSNKIREIESFLISECKSNPKAINILNALITLYGDTDYRQSRFLFDRIPNDHKDYVTINSMMTVLMNHNQFEEVLSLHTIFCQNESLKNTLNLFNETTHLLALKSCTKMNDLQNGEDIIARYRLMDSTNIKIQTALIDFYGNSNHSPSTLDRALFTFHQIPKKNDIPIIPINAMMTALLNHDRCDHHENVKTLYNQYDCAMIGDDVTHLLLFKACLKTSDLSSGLRIHGIIGSHVQQSNALKVSLIEFYAHFGRVDDIESVYDSIRSDRRNGIIHRAMISGFIQNSLFDEALSFYEKIKSSDEVMPHLLAIKCCIQSNRYNEGRQIIDDHDLETKCRVNLDLHGMTILIQFHGHFGRIQDSERIYYRIGDEEKDLFLMNTMMNMYFTHNLDTECIAMFNEIKAPNAMSFVIALKACSQSLLYRDGQSIHNKLRQDSYREILLDMTVNVELINLYGKAGRMDMVKEIMNKYQQQNGVMIVVKALRFIFKIFC